MLTKSTRLLLGALIAVQLAGLSSESRAAGNSREGWYVTDASKKVGYWDGPLTNPQAGAKLSAMCRTYGSKPQYQYSKTGKLANKKPKVIDYPCGPLPPSGKPTPPPTPKPTPPPPSKITPKPVPPPEPRYYVVGYLKVSATRYDPSKQVFYSTGTQKQILQDIETFFRSSKYSKSQVYFPNAVRIN